MSIVILPWDIINDSINHKDYIRIPAWDIWMETTGHQKYVHEQLIAIFNGFNAMEPELN